MTNELSRRDLLSNTTRAGIITAPIIATLAASLGKASGSDLEFIPFPIPAWKDYVSYHQFFELPMGENPSYAKTDIMKCTAFKFAKDFQFPAHVHPQGEYTFVIDGSFKINQPLFDSTTGLQIFDSNGVGATEEIEYKADDYIYMPANSIHGVTKFGSNGATIISITPAQIKILRS